MADPKATKAPKPQDDTAAAEPYTLDQVAELFELSPGTILSHKDYGTHVIAVTTDGRKLTAFK
jgi:hypothetical protein